MDKKLKMLEEIIGYTFKNEHLLPHALTHSSYANERHWDKKRCNERLEFLGAAVLEVVSSEFLFLNHPDMPEGEMTKLRASLVCEPALAYCAEAIYLDGCLANAKEFIHRFILNDIEHKQLFYDSKTILQEIVQADFKDPLTYELIREEGPDHNKTFEVCAKIGSHEIGRGAGRTKKAAEQLAAYRGICQLKKTDQ